MAVTGMGTRRLCLAPPSPHKSPLGKQSTISPSGGGSALNPRAHLGQLGCARRAADLSPSPGLCESDGTEEPASPGGVTLRPATDSLRVPAAHGNPLVPQGRPHLEHSILSQPDGNKGQREGDQERESSCDFQLGMKEAAGNRAAIFKYSAGRAAAEQRRARPVRKSSKNKRRDSVGSSDSCGAQRDLLVSRGRLLPVAWPGSPVSQAPLDRAWEGVCPGGWG